MREASQRVVEILNDKIRTNRFHHGEFSIVEGPMEEQIGLYYFDRERNHRIGIVITRGGGYNYFYNELISTIALLKTVVYETSRGTLLEVYNFGELMRNGTYLHENNVPHIKKLKLI